MDFPAKDVSIQTLIQKVNQRFGRDAFPVDDLRDDAPRAIGFTSRLDRRVFFSVAATGERAGRYSVLVEVPAAEEDRVFAVDVAEDRDDVFLEQLLDIFATYQVL